MAKVGNFGKIIVFSTSNKKILTFQGLQQDIGARWAKHDRILKRPLSEFLGADLRTITFNIDLNAQLGVRPRKTMERIEKAIEKGEVAKLVIGGKAIGRYRWKITKMSETWNNILSKGELVSATLSLSLEEYL